MTERLTVRPRSHSPATAEAARRLEDEVWGHLGFLSATNAHRLHYDRLLDQFAEYQLCLVDRQTEELVALANCVPIRWDGETLPRTGWDWLVATGLAGGGTDANTIGALAVSVPERHRGAGHARRMIAELKAMGAQRGLGSVIVPVRPSAKTLHQGIAMDRYVGWTDEQGRPFDPWLRSHLAQGGRVAGICDRSMVVEQPVAFWETWLGRRLTQSGPVEIEGGLVPVLIDLERDRGLYAEPNVWMTYGETAGLRVN